MSVDTFGKRGELITEGFKPIGAGLSRDIATGEKVEAELDAFVAKRHRERVATEGERDEEAAWAESARRLLAKRAEEKRAGLAGFYRHLQNVYTSRAAECGRTADFYERKSA
jgi:hypothetical protein